MAQSRDLQADLAHGAPYIALHVGSTSGTGQEAKLAEPAQLLVLSTLALGFGVNRQSSQAFFREWSGHSLLSTQAGHQCYLS